MTDAELAQIVDDCIEQVTSGLEPDLDALAEGLSDRQRRELASCVRAARHLESAIVEDSRQHLSRSRIINIASPSSDDTLPDTRSAQHTELAAGQILGDFEIIREIGRGGMGIVFEARQKSLDRIVAIKILPPGVGWNRTVLERFQREARAAARLQHANIIPVYQVAEEKGIHYFAMQLIDGFPLSRLARAPLAQTDSDSNDTAEQKRAANAWPSTIPKPTDPSYYRFVANAMRQVATALDHAHNKGILHRDIKPSNLLVDPNRNVWIADFGLARLSTDASVTISGQLIGTLNYMSPEQAAGGGSVGPASDIYSLGATLYELLTLRPPFGIRSTQDLLFAIQDEDPPRPTRINPRVPADLEVIALRAMEKEPNRRYADPGQVAADLGRWLDDIPIRARPTTVWRRTYKWVRRKRIIVSAAAIVLAVLVAAIWMTRSAAKQTRTLVQQQQAEGQVGAAQKLFDQGQFGQAEQEFSQAANAFSELLSGTGPIADAISTPVRIGIEALPNVYLGLIALRNQTLRAQEQAARQFDLALRAAPENALLKSLKLLTQTRDYDRVISVIRQIESFPPDTDWGPFAADAYLAIAERVHYYDRDAAIRLATMAWDASGIRRLTKALAFRGWLFLQAGQYDQALDDLDVACALEQNPRYFLWRARARSAQGQNSVARMDFDKALELAPDSFEIRGQRLVWLAQDWGLVPVPDPPRDAEPLQSLPRALEAELASLEALTPADYTDHYYLASAYQALRIPDRAQVGFARAAETIPGGTVGPLAGDVFANLARLAVANRNPQDALDAYERALDACPRRELFEHRAQLLTTLERWEPAIEDYRQALRRGANPVPLRMAMAQAYHQLDRPDAAVQELLQIISREPGHRLALELMADIRIDQNDPSAAVDLLSMVAGLYPDDFNVLHKRARARLLKGDESGARADLQSAIRKGLDLPSAQHAIGRFYEDRSRHRDALNAYTMALDHNPDDLLASLGCIRALARLNRVADALDHCQLALSTRPDQPELLAQRADLNELIGNEAAAIGDWRKVVAARPQNQNARWRLARLLLYAGVPALRDPRAVAELVPDPSPEDRERTQTEHRILAHLYCFQQRFSRSAAEMNRLRDRSIEDWMVVSRLRSRGISVAGSQEPPDSTEDMNVTLPPWLKGLQQSLLDMGEATATKDIESTYSEPEQ